METHEKLVKLKEILAEMGTLVVGYSGGVDSTFLAAVAYEVLGSRMLAVTARSETYPSSEAQEAEELAKAIGFRHLFIDTSELGIEGYVDNPPERCFYCKGELFNRLIDVARQENIEFVADASNVDDVHDYRPGMRAAKELGVRSPLREAEMSKADIRALSREMGLPTWNKPSFACLASRFPYGTRITVGRLNMVGAAEEFLRSQGVRQVRVRHYPISPEVEHEAVQKEDAAIARIEVGAEEMALLFNEDFRKHVVEKLKAIGYLYVTLDLQGYRTGSMNETLEAK